MLRRATAINATTMVVNIVFQLASISILSRILTPTQIGTYSIGMAFIALLTAIREFGLGIYIVQERDLTVGRWNTAVTLTAISSWSLAGIVFAAASFLADLYRSPETGRVIQLIAPSFLFVPWIASVTARLQRDLRYGTVAIISLACTGSSALVAVLLAQRGYGAISLAWGALTGTAINFLCCLAVRQPDWRWRISLTHVRDVLPIGWKTVYGSTLQQIGGALPELIIGRLIGLHDLAMFNRANAVRGLVSTHMISVVQGVLLPKFAQECRGAELIGNLYRSRNRLLCGILIPVYACTIVLAEPLVMVLFGDQWADAILLTRILCAAPMFAMPIALMRTVTIAAGNMDAIVRLETYTLLSRILAVGTGSMFGIVWVAAFMFVETLIYVSILGSQSQGMLNHPARNIFLHCKGDYALAALTAAACATSLHFGSTLLPAALQTPVTVLTVSSALGFLVWLSALPLLNREIYREVGWLSQQLLRRKSWNSERS